MPRKLLFDTFDTCVKPFLKWAGGKSRLVPELSKKFPKKAKRFVEPFAGSLSVSLGVDYPEYIVNDSNEDVIGLYQTFQRIGKEFIGLCKEMFADKYNTEESFYTLRSEFNTTSSKIRKSVLLVYLNRHCYNGLVRYNASGEFNTPFGKYDEPYFPQDEMLACLGKLCKFELHHEDFRTIFDLVKINDVVYCDPPYAPLSASASFDAYDSGGFSLKDHIDLAQCAADASKRGATVVISNHYNWYTKELYKSMFCGKLTTLDVSRTISGKTDKRDAVRELIAVFESDKEGN
jgi:DNA adenine methylase